MKTSLKINFVFLQIQSNFHSGTWHVNKESHILKRTNRGQSMSHITGRQGVVAESWTIQPPGQCLDRAAVRKTPKSQRLYTTKVYLLL